MKPRDPVLLQQIIKLFHRSQSPEAKLPKLPQCNCPHLSFCHLSLQPRLQETCYLWSGQGAPYMRVTSWPVGWGLYSLWDVHIDHQMLTGAYGLNDICDVRSCRGFFEQGGRRGQSFLIFTFICFLSN